MSTQTLPPTPSHILRSHTSSISALCWSDDDERIYSGDTSGKVIVTSTRTRRAISIWNAHADLILGVQEWDNIIITQGRDNKLHVWDRIFGVHVSASIGGSANLPSLPTPSLKYSMDVNAINFCRFSILGGIACSSQSTEGKQLLIGLPNLIDSSTVDIWSLPDQARMHAAIGQEIKKSMFSDNPGGRNNSGIVMSIHIYRAGSTSTSSQKLRVLLAYEDGSVVLREYTQGEKPSVESQGWIELWKSKVHVESIMAMSVSPNNAFALTVSADHIIGFYDLTSDDVPIGGPGVLHRTKHPGNASVDIRHDGRICAVGGWDGKIRLYSTKTFKSLGTLKYHKASIQCVAFPKLIGQVGEAGQRSGQASEGGDTDALDDDDWSDDDVSERNRWLVGGSKDNRVSVWLLIDFSKSS
ncbi:WD-40 repeat-containing protein [Panaeolus papilionaceus]|nr:WD-40 repeat-containing protein [Panaeolus papilionaceus]